MQWYVAHQSSWMCGTQGFMIKLNPCIVHQHLQISILRLLDLICMNKYLVRLIMNIGSAQRYLNIWVSTYKQRFYLLRKLSNILMQVSANQRELFPFKKFLLCMIFRSFHLQLSSFSLKIQNWLWIYAHLCTNAQ